MSNKNEHNIFVRTRKWMMYSLLFDRMFYISFVFTFKAILILSNSQSVMFLLIFKLPFGGCKFLEVNNKMLNYGGK